MIGAGQAGLAIGHFLARQGWRFVILESADSIGAAWRTRWDSLVLFTPRRYSALPGLVFPGDPDGYPTRDEVIAYLEQYAATFELPVQVNSRVHKVASNNGGLASTSATGTLPSRWARTSCGSGGGELSTYRLIFRLKSFATLLISSNGTIRA